MYFHGFFNSSSARPCPSAAAMVLQVGGTSKYSFLKHSKLTSIPSFVSNIVNNPAQKCTAASYKTRQTSDWVIKGWGSAALSFYKKL